MSTRIAGQHTSTETDTSQRWMFLNGEFVREGDVRIGIQTHALHNGTGVIEGIRAYWNAGRQQLYLLEVLAHYQRFHRSARIVRMAIPESPERLVDITVELLRRSDCREDTYIRPIFFKCLPEMSMNLAAISDSLAVHTFPLG